MAENKLDVETIAKKARQASWKLQSLSTKTKNTALKSMKSLLAEKQEELLAANQADIKAAQQAVQEGKLSSPLLKRLDLFDVDGAKFRDLLSGIDDVERLDDPVGKVLMAKELDKDLDLYRVACPVGVICIIFEARPECCVQISSLCLKSGNAVILKGGSEAANSNRALVSVIQASLVGTGVPQDAVQLVETRDEVAALLNLDDYIDLVIPRGSNSLVKHVQNNTRIPVLGHADGLCSVYLDRSADVKKAVSVVVDGKTSYAVACNATETLLVHSDIVATLLPVVGKALSEAGVTMAADQCCLPHLPPLSTRPALERDFDTEFLDLSIAVKAVDGLEEAIAHINVHGSHHTDTIVTEDKAAAAAFMQGVDSAGVYCNASTRFADGFRYGFGAEIGVSTNKTHARGPVGLEGLLSYKYRLYGNGQGSAMFGPEHPYTHRDIANHADRL